MDICIDCLAQIGRQAGGCAGCVFSRKSSESEPVILDDYLIFPAASPPGNICRLEPLISYLSAAPQAEPHADGFSSGSSAAPQAEPHAAGFSSGLSAAPQAEPHADAGVSSIFLLHPKRFESAIMISSIFLSVKRSFSFAISL